MTPSPLPSSIRLGNWRVFLFHQEQKEQGNRAAAATTIQEAPTASSDQQPEQRPDEDPASTSGEQPQETAVDPPMEPPAKPRQARLEAFIKRSRSLPRSTASPRSSSHRSPPRSSPPHRSPSNRSRSNRSPHRTPAQRSKRNLSEDDVTPSGKAPRSEKSIAQPDWFEGMPEEPSKG